RAGRSAESSQFRLRGRHCVDRAFVEFEWPRISGVASAEIQLEAAARTQRKRPAGGILEHLVPEPAHQMGHDRLIGPHLRRTSLGPVSSTTARLTGRAAVRIAFRQRIKGEYEIVRRLANGAVAERLQQIDERGTRTRAL